MDETTRSIIERITVTYKTPTRIPTGQLCTVFYDCVRLTPNDLARLAAQTLGNLGDPSFEAVVGIAFNGILFASALAGGKHVGILQPNGELWGPELRGKKVLLVDDVVATGDRMREAERKVSAQGAKVIAYCCIVNRSEGKWESAGKPLYSAYSTAMV